MANYPSTPSYGANYGARDQQNPPYLPPTYPNQYLQSDDGRTSQAHMGHNYDTSMNAYGYNRTIPPFSAAAVAAGVPPLPIFQGWNQDSIPLPPYNPPPYTTPPAHNATHYNGYSGNVHTQSYYQPASQSNYIQPQIPKPFEQEVDEGEFEDGVVATNTPPVGYASSQYRPSDGTGYVDSAQRAVYSRPHEYSSQQSYTAANSYNYPTRDSSQNGRQQSASYSPYASSAGAGNNEQVKGAQQQVAYAPSNTQDHISDAAKSSYGSSKKPTNPPEHNINKNGHHVAQGEEQPTPATSLSGIPVNTKTVSTSSGKSVAESRKKAQGAILNLWPYDVRYQTYIDEGFKEDIIDRLFDDLKMTKTSSKPGSGRDGLSEPESFTGGHNISSGQDDATSLTPSFAGSRPAEATSLRAIQDVKIPMSLKTNGNAASSNATLPQTPVEQNKIPSFAPVKSAEMTEKQRALELKKEALRKSREERAQKKDAAKSVPSVVENIPEPEQTKVESEIVPEASNLATDSLSKSPSVPKNEVQSAAQHSPPISRQEIVSLPPPEIPPVQQVPSIPGLFLVSTPASSTPPVAIQNALPLPTLNNARKRPVAADFDEPTSSMAPFKRPFGESRLEKRLVIDVSEEEFDSEDEDVAMELESQADQDSPAQPPNKMSDQRATVIQNLPSLGTLPARKPWSPPPFSSATSTPPSLHQTPRGAFGQQESLQRKEIEIEVLKKKIAEAEAKKKARQTPNGNQTPRTSESRNSEGKTTTQPSATIHSKVEEVPGPIIDEQKLLEKQKLEEAKAQAVELKRVEAEQRRLRREKIATDLAALEEEEQRRLQSLAKKKAEIAEEEARVRLTQSEKQKMMEEMERLGQDTEEQLQIEKDKLNDLEAEVNGGPPLPLAPTPSINSQPPQSAIDQNIIAPKMLASGLAQTPQPSSPAEFPTSETMIIQDPAISNVDITERPKNGHLEQTALDEHDNNISDESEEEPKEALSTDRALEAALQEAVRAEADSHAHTEDEMDIEVSYTPDPDQLAPESSSSVASPPAGSPEYSPVLDRSVLDTADRESDDYEPPEATPTVDAPSPIESPPFSPAPPATISDHVDDATLYVNSMQNSSRSANENTEETIPLANGTSPRIHENRSEETNQVKLFTPYESPLKHFHAYRFHPDFKQNVSGGLKSMTYSHKIDAKKEFCHHELEGRCNDPNCDMQHFKDISLPDDAVLTALGSPDEFRGEQRERFCVGLKEVLLDLRLRKIRDFNIIASEIIAHREKFLGDASKVLPLEGITI